MGAAAQDALRCRRDSHGLHRCVGSTGFFLAIAFEWWWGWRLSGQGQASSQTYRWDDAINSISLGMISQLSAVFTRVFRIAIYTLVYEQVAVLDTPDFWQSGVGILLVIDERAYAINQGPRCLLRL